MTEKQIRRGTHRSTGQSERTAIQLTHVPYKGAAPALQGVLSGEIDALMDPGVSFPHIKSGKLRIISVLSPSRSPFFPDVPTTVESGLQDVHMDMLTGLWAPVATPHHILEKMSAAVERVVKGADFSQKMSGLGVQPLHMPPAEFTRYVREETRVLSTLIRQRKITAE